MESGVIERLEALRPEIKAKWETLLRVEPVSSPLASPDALVHLIDWTLDTLFVALRPVAARRKPAAESPATSIADCKALCQCGRNPLLAYFIAGEQAMLETLVLVQANGNVRLDPEPATTAAELKQVLVQVARREIEAFCAVCRHRHEPPNATAPHPAPLRR